MLYNSLFFVVSMARRAPIGPGRCIDNAILVSYSVRIRCFQSLVIDQWYIGIVNPSTYDSVHFKGYEPHSVILDIAN